MNSLHPAQKVKEKNGHSQIAAFLLALFLISSSILLVSAQTWLYPHIRGEIRNQYQLKEETIQENYRDLLRYNLSFFSEELEFQGLFMSAEGRQHFVEVRQIFLAVKTLWLVSGLLLIPLSIRLLKEKKPRFLKNGGYLSLFLPLVLALPLLLDFNRAFIVFHKLFFSNDYWIFDPARDPIILYLPQELFFHLGVLILVALCLLAFLSILLEKILSKRS